YDQAYVQYVCNLKLKVDDIHDHLCQSVNESLSGMGNGHCVANLSDDSESKPLLVVKKGEESGSITAIINRQLQGGDDDEESLLEHQLEAAVVVGAEGLAPLS
ncbi:hypothetical protein Hamer_G004056, partial [Homarus americanus]